MVLPFFFGSQKFIYFPREMGYGTPSQRRGGAVEMGYFPREMAVERGGRNPFPWILSRETGYDTPLNNIPLFTGTLPIKKGGCR